MNMTNLERAADPISKEDVSILIKCLIDDGNLRDALYVKISFSLGLRVSDVLKLKHSDFDYNVMLIDEKKTGKARRLPIGANLRAIYNKYIRTIDATDDYIFVNRYGRPLTSNNFNQKLKDWRFDYLKNSIKNFSTHSFRKGFGRNYYNEMGKTEAAITMLQKTFNHSNSSITLAYIGITKEQINEVYDIND